MTLDSNDMRSLIKDISALREGDEDISKILALVERFSELGPADKKDIFLFLLGGKVRMDFSYQKPNDILKVVDTDE